MITITTSENDCSGKFKISTAYERIKMLDLTYLAHARPADGIRVRVGDTAEINGAAGIIAAILPGIDYANS